MKIEKQYVDTTFSNFEKVNEEFLKCTISVNSYDQIANGTKFRKEAIEKARPTLGYAPVIGYFKGDDFSGHGIEYKITDEGFEEVVKTIPFGVCIKGTDRWEMLTKPNGEQEEYMTVDCYLWSRYADAIDVVKDNMCNQSMEVTINSAEYTDSYYDIADFNYSALCILGKDVTPAFNLAKIRTSDKFSKEDFKACYSEMTEALDRFLNFEEGGEDLEDNKELETEKTEEMAKKRKCSSCDTEIETNEEFDENEEFVCEECMAKKKKCEDESEEEKEDFEEKYNEVVAELNEVKAKFVDLETELETAKSDYSTLETETKELREYKANIERVEYEAKVDEVLSKYSELETVDGYSELIKDKYSIDLNELEKSIKIFCFDNQISLGKKVKKNFSKEEIKIPVVNTKEDVSVNTDWNILDKYIKK